MAKNRTRDVSILGYVVGICAFVALLLSFLIWVFAKAEINLGDLGTLLVRLHGWAQFITLSIAAVYFVLTQINPKNRTIWLIVVIVIIVLALLGVLGI